MTTEKQWAANRRNASHSTGPRSEAGKAAVSGNATRYGLSARRVVLRGESEEEFVELQHALARELRPEGTMETFLVQQVAAGMWRLRRCLEIETGLFDAHAMPGRIGREGVAEVFASDARYGTNSVSKLVRYESHLERMMQRALRTLVLLQAARRGEGLPDAGDGLPSLSPLGAPRASSPDPLLQKRRGSRSAAPGLRYMQRKGLHRPPRASDLAGR